MHRWLHLLCAVRIRIRPCTHSIVSTVFRGRLSLRWCLQLLLCLLLLRLQLNLCLLLLLLQQLLVVEIQLSHILLGQIHTHVRDIDSSDASKDHGYQLWRDIALERLVKHILFHLSLLQLEILLPGLFLLLSASIILHACLEISPHGLFLTWPSRRGWRQRAQTVTAGGL